MDLAKSWLKTKEYLDNLDVGYGNLHGFGLDLAINYPKYSFQEIANLTNNLYWYKQWLQVCTRIYLESLTSGHSMAELYVQGLDSKTKEIWLTVAKSGYISEETNAIPRYFRLDLVNINTRCNCVETQIPGHGWGIAAALSSFEKEGNSFVKKYTDSLRNFYQKEHIRLLHIRSKPNHYKETRYFANVLERYGVYTDFADESIPNDFIKYDLIQRHYFDELSQHENSRDLIKASIEGDVIIDPPLNITFDSKVNLVLPFHKDHYSEFSDEVRALFPPTILIENKGEMDYYDGSNLTRISLAEIKTSPSSKRRYIVKYAGVDPKLRSGSRAVHHLGRISINKGNELIDEVLKRVQMGEPWIIQFDAGEKYQIDYLDKLGEIRNESRYLRLNPFVHLGNDRNQLLGLTYFHRNFWKVAGKEDSAVGFQSIGA